METPQQMKAGVRKDGGARGKGKAGMKRCHYCGAKNKASFEYCIRCSEPLDVAAPEGIVARERATLSRLFVGAIVGIVVLVAAAIVVRGLSSDAPATSTAPSPTAGGGANVATPTAAPSPSIDSQETLATFNAGLAAFNGGDYGTAVGHFNEVIRTIPENPLAHQYLGLSHFHLEDYAAALSALDEARELRPDSFEILDHYVTVAKKAGDLESGASALRSYIARHPDDAEPRLELSRIARQMGNPDEALEQAAYLANERTESPEFKYEYGVSLKESGRLDEAKAALQTAIELDPASAVAHHALGVTELLSGKPAQAVGPLEAAVSRAPDNGDFRFSLAQAYEKLDRIQESLAAYEAYLKHAAPSDPRAKVVREGLGVAKRALAERAQAAGKSQGL